MRRKRRKIENARGGEGRGGERKGRVMEIERQVIEK